MCYEFVKAFDVFLSNPDYYDVSHRIGVLESCVDQDGWDLFPRMVKLYRQAGGGLRMCFDVSCVGTRCVYFVPV